MESYKQSVSNFFDVLQQKRQSNDEAMQRMNRFLSARFNVFDFIQPNENALSDIIADMLDHNGKHGQGTAFLDALRSRLSEADIPRGTPLRVHREARTTFLAHSFRRIDIVIDFGDYGFGIENKLWAADQDNQLADYQYELDRAFQGRYCLLYLTPDGKRPSSMESQAASEALESGRLQLFSYQMDVPAWLDECIRNCVSEKFRWFLRDFREYVQARFPVTFMKEATDEDQ